MHYLSTILVDELKMYHYEYAVQRQDWKCMVTLDIGPGTQRPERKNAFKTHDTPIVIVDDIKESVYIVCIYYYNNL